MIYELVYEDEEATISCPYESIGTTVPMYGLGAKLLKIFGILAINSANKISAKFSFLAILKM